MLQRKSSEVQADTAGLRLRHGVRKIALSAPQHIAMDVSVKKARQGIKDRIIPDTSTDDRMFAYMSVTNPTYVWCCNIILLLAVSLISNTAVSTLPTGTMRTHTRFFFETVASGHT